MSADGGPGLTRAVVVAVLVVGAILVAAGIVLSIVPRSIPQPIAFNHARHVDDLGMECVDCHRYARTGVRATIPNIETCGDCHEETLTESEEEARVVEHVQAGDPIPWRKIYRVPDHVYFSHRRHTAIAGVDCETCHGPMSDRSEPVTRPYRRVTMEGCVECHRRSNASSDCIHCHV